MSASVESGYTEFLSGVQPLLVGLNSCKATLDRELFLGSTPESEDMRLLHSELRAENIEGDHFNVIASFSVAIKLLDERGKPQDKSLLEIDCSFYGHFHCSKEVDLAHVNRFASAEALILFMPYLRQFVSDLTARMWIPPVMIPIQIGAVTSGSKRHSPSKRQIGARKK